MLRNADRLKAADVELTRALAIAEELHGANGEETATTLSALGALRTKQGRRDEARAFLTRALNIRLKLNGEDDEDVQLVRERLAAVDEPPA
jgi:hypothetical protein